MGVYFSAPHTLQASRGKVMALNSLRSNLLEQLSRQLPAESTEYRYAACCRVCDAASASWPVTIQAYSIPAFCRDLLQRLAPYDEQQPGQPS